MSGVLKVYDGVPMPPARRPKRRKFPFETMRVGQMVFDPDRSTRSVSAYVSRVTRSMPGKFRARHCWVVFDENEQPREVPEGTPGAIEGTGVWRTE